MLSYIGGKSKIGKWIVNYIPKDIETYVEPFSGQFWVYFNMNLNEFPNLKNVVYNDINPLNYNLFQCVKNPEVFKLYLDNIDCQKVGIENTPKEYADQFYQFQSEIFDENFNVGNQDYETAAKYVYVLTSVFSGSKPETSKFIDLKGKYKSKFLTFRDKLEKPKWIDYFNKITHIENKDFGDIIKEYDSVNTHFYCDPPYFKTENYYSNHTFLGDEHKRLSDVLSQIQGTFSVSYYDFPMLKEWYGTDKYTWEKKEFNKAAGAKKGTKQSKSEELLILKKQ